MKIKHKYFVPLAIAGAIAFGVSGCSKKLDLQPYNALTDESIFTTPERVNLALNGVYDAAQSGIYNGAIDRGYPFGAANVQQNDCRGEDVINLAAFYQFTYQSTYNPTTLNNVWYFNSLYRLINFANVAIDGCTKAGEGGIISSDVANSAVAEMRFLRALSHHELVVFFCRPFLDGNGDKLGVPYRDFPVNSAAAVDAVRNDPRPTVAQTYSRILEDLDFAIANLPIVQPGANRRIRAERAAAITLKMKVLMHMGRFQDAKTEGDKLVPAAVTPGNPAGTVSPIGGYALTATPQAAFTQNSLSTENIFTIRHDALDNPGVNASLGTMYGPAELGARGLVALSPTVWNRTEWLAGDARRSLFVEGVNALGPTRRSIFTLKWPDFVQRGNHNPIFRYAEVLLMLAECEARIGGGVSQRAVDLLNVVRNRSIPDPANNQYTLSSFANQTELLQAVLLERRFEFAMEGKRWTDITRLANDPVAAVRTPGIPAKWRNGSDGSAIYSIGGPTLPSVTEPFIPYADFRFIWPIPIDEFVQNPIFLQNPGY
jgi:hypothetical protein